MGSFRIKALSSHLRGEGLQSKATSKSREEKMKWKKSVMTQYMTCMQTQTRKPGVPHCFRKKKESKERYAMFRVIWHLYVSDNK